MSSYIPGELARLSLAVVNEAGDAADPGALRLKTRAQGGTVATLTYGVDVAIVKDSVGNYHADILLANAGLWAWRWELDAPNAGAVEGTITVLPSHV